MTTQDVLDRFVDKCPLAVMARSIIEALLGDQLNEVFERNRSRQYDHIIPFSVLAMSMAEIVIGATPNRHQAYVKFKEEIRVSVIAYYKKLNNVEPSISEAVVQYSADRAAEMLDELDFSPRIVLPGYRCFVIDGNHLQKTEKRLKQTRGLCAAPLPGIIVARYDLQNCLLDRAYLLEDAHAQESSVLGRLLDDLLERDLVIADRHFCIVQFCFDVDARRACFVIRQHGRLKGEIPSVRRRIGRTATGMVYESPLVISNGTVTMTVRRITVELDEPTREGDKEIHILSNVPEADASACELATLYHQRWEIENAFHVLTMTFACESKSNCKPRCALFQFCMAMFAYNCRQIQLASLCAEHAKESVDRMSQYQVAVDTVSSMDGMLVAIDEEEWEELTPRDVAGLATFLREVSRRVDVRAYRKSVRGPKKPPPKRKRCKNGTHVSTHRLLRE